MLNSTTVYHMSHLAFSEETKFEKISILQLWRIILVHVSLSLFKKKSIYVRIRKPGISVFKACPLTTGDKKKIQIEWLQISGVIKKKNTQPWKMPQLTLYVTQNIQGGKNVKFCRHWYWFLEFEKNPQPDYDYNY